MEAATVIVMVPFLLKHRSKQGKILRLFKLDGQQTIVHFLILNTSLSIWNISDENLTFRGSPR